MQKKIIALLTFSLIFYRPGAKAQGVNPVLDTLLQHFEYYRLSQPESLLFLHTDKTVYLNNDMIWFAAYLLDGRNVRKHTVLSAALVRNADRYIAAKGRFIMQNGLASGNLKIEDTIPPGHYSLIAYTNRLYRGKPVASFIQPLTLRTTIMPGFNVVTTLDTVYHDGINTRVIVEVSHKDVPLEGAKISYQIGKDLKSSISGKAKTNVIGSYNLLVPKDHITERQHDLQLLVTSGKENKLIHLDLPVKKETTALRFYPEGGHLITAINNLVGWETKTATGKPLQLKGILYRDHAPIDTLATDSTGMGTFYLKPEQGAVYTFKLSGNPSEAYLLPKAVSGVPVLHLTSGLAEDTLTAFIEGKVPGNFSLILHNYRQVFSAITFHTSAKDARLKIGLQQIPRGLVTATLLNAQGRPFADRTFFVHYGRRPKLTIGMDRNEIYTRQKVSLNLKVTSYDGKPMKGLVSVAVVQDDRLAARNENNIEHYVYLESQLDQLPVKENGKDMDEPYLEESLLIHGWSKYNWPDLIALKESDTLDRIDSLQFIAHAGPLSGKLKEPVQLLLIKDSVRLIKFDSDLQGEVKFKDEELYMPAGKKPLLVVSGDSQEFIISVKDPYNEEDKIIAATIDPSVYDPPAVQKTGPEVVEGFEHTRVLKVVNIIAKKSLYGQNACGDFVCRYHILNCPNHRTASDNHPPQEGEMVYVGGSGREIYEGCGTPVKTGMMSFLAITAGREFYGADYSVINPAEADYLSTICWKHHVLLDPEQGADISFYTSDVTGKFRVVVQGITESGVVYAGRVFTVQKKSLSHF